jgi:hypothetical protein
MLQFIFIFSPNSFGLVSRWAVDLIREPFDFWGEDAPTVSPSVSSSPTTETRPPTNRPTQAPTVTCGTGCPRGVVNFLPTIDCKGYYTCSNGVPGDVTLCEGGTLFDVSLQMCNWPWEFSCRCFEVILSPPTTPSPTTKAQATSKPTYKATSPMPVTLKPSSSPTKKVVSL